jgi:2,5-dihydroxypyridine 5,6-dioxygenase
MPVGPTKLVAMWREVLALSKLAADESVLILTSANSNPLLVDASLRAAAELGGKVLRLDIPSLWDPGEAGTDPTAVTGRSQLDDNPMALAAMKEADLVIDLVFLLFTPAQREVLKSGTRMLLAYEPPEILARVMPSLDDRRRVLAARDTYLAGKEIRITSAAGTDLRGKIGDYPITAEYGFVDEPGRWDHWPSGFPLTWPNELQTNGAIVLDRGDIILPQKYYVAEPVRLTMKEGYCVAIEGGVDAALLRDYMESFNDPEAFAMSHIGWGLQPRARWSTLALYDRERTIGMDARAYEGNFLCSLGPNNEAGGSRNTACHIDIPIRNCTVRLDGVDMVTRGVVQDGQGRALA